jgi:hypothetical protein
MDEIFDHVWETKVKKVSNGYFIINKTSDTVTRLAVAEKPIDSRRAELEAFLEMVLELKDFFGVYNSKHEKLNLKLEIVETETES